MWRKKSTTFYNSQTSKQKRWNTNPKEYEYNQSLILPPGKNQSAFVTTASIIPLNAPVVAMLGLC